MNPTPAPSPAEHEEARQTAAAWSAQFTGEGGNKVKLARAYLDLRAKAEAYFHAIKTTPLPNESDSHETVMEKMRAARDTAAALRSCLSSERAP